MSINSLCEDVGQITILYSPDHNLSGLDYNLCGSHDNLCGSDRFVNKDIHCVASW